MTGRSVLPSLANLAVQTDAPQEAHVLWYINIPIRDQNTASAAVQLNLGFVQQISYKLSMDIEFLLRLAREATYRNQLPQLIQLILDAKRQDKYDQSSILDSSYGVQIEPFTDANFVAKLREIASPYRNQLQGLNEQLESHPVDRFGHFY